jgi:hypothetical protein
LLSISIANKLGLTAGLNIYQFDDLRELFERGGYSLTSSNHLRQLIPLLRERELERLRLLTSNRPYSFIFDGATHVGEFVIVIIRQIDTNTLDYEQNVIALTHLDKSSNSSELASILNECRERIGNFLLSCSIILLLLLLLLLCFFYFITLIIIINLLGLHLQNFLFAKHDSAAVNGAAINHLKPLYRNLNDNPCISHILSNIGKKFAVSCPLAHSFVSDFLCLLRHSPKAALALKNQTGSSLFLSCLFNATTQSYLILQIYLSQN